MRQMIINILNVTFYIDASTDVVLLSELDDGSAWEYKLVAVDGYDTI